MFGAVVTPFNRAARDLSHQWTLEKPRPFWAPLPT